MNNIKDYYRHLRFKKGGQLDPPTTVNHGTKEYAKAYNDGTFADVPNQLDEVVITADKKTGRNILEDYPHYNNLNAQDKEHWNDSSPIGRSVRRRAQTTKGLAGDAANMGMQLGQGALSAMQTPQSAMVEGVEGMRGKPSNMNNALPGKKQRVPSDAWGYENPEGFMQNAANFTMDAVADPTNLVGAGYADDIARGVKGLARNGMREGMEGSLSNASLLNKVKDFANNDKVMNRLETVSNALGPKIKKALNPMHHKRANEALGDANKWMDDWYSHPETTTRLGTIDSKYDMSFLTDPNVRNPQYSASFESGYNKFDNFVDGESRVHRDNYGVSGWGLDAYKDSTKRQNLVSKYIDTDNIRSTAVHEGNHGFTNGNQHITDDWAKALQEPFDMTDFSPRNADGSFNTHKDYLLDPTEINARVSEIRLEHGIKPGQKVSEELADKIVEKGWYGESIVDQNFYHLIKDRRPFLDMLNKVPVATGAIATGVGAAAASSNNQEFKHGGHLNPTKAYYRQLRSKR